MRFIVNLGRATTVAFPGAKAGPAGQRPGPGVGTGWGVVGAKRAQRKPPVKLTFKPVNSFLQNVYQVGAGTWVQVTMGASVPGRRHSYSACVLGLLICQPWEHGLWRSAFLL